VLYQASGVVSQSANLTFDGTTLTAAAVTATTNVSIGTAGDLINAANSSYISFYRDGGQNAIRFALQGGSYWKTFHSSGNCYFQFVPSGGATVIDSYAAALYLGVSSGSAIVIDTSNDITLGGHCTITDAKNFILNTTTGTKIGTGTTQKLGLWNATPVTQRSNIGAVTDNTGGTAGATIDAVTPGADTIDVSILHDTLATIAQRLNRIEQVFQDTGMTS
jgi:hypothetical protein